MFLRQTEYQTYFGQTRTLGEATRTDGLIDEENHGSSVTKAMPGFVAMPALQFANVVTNLDVYVDLEVQFGFELEGDSYIGLSPANNSARSVLLRTFQWEPIPA